MRVPGSKSYTNRALVCALLAEGTSVLTGALDADDTRAMAAAIEALGATVRWEGDRIEVGGTGGALRPGPLALDVRDSGTCARFLAPVLALGQGEYRLDGSEQLRRRPMGPLMGALRSLGVRVDGLGGGDALPFVIHGQGRLPPGPVDVPANVSSQFLSGLMLAGVAVRPTTEVVSAPYLRMTEQVRAAFAGGATTYAVEPDATAASYFYALNALFPDGHVEVEGLGPGTIQGDYGIVELLQQRHPYGDVDLRDMPDIAPTLAVVAAFAEGRTTVRGIDFIRGHETDRIAAVVTELRRIGIEAEEHEDGFSIVGGRPHGAVVQTYRDHRMAMSFALVGLKVPGIEIADPGCVAKTFPGYWDVLDSLA
ncbi:MAG TPA: 3-phosphoshikimate 1-carboxyvinyltransferase [Acidimicrobiales bacterium]|nr:3-phosphoshikimate 1-carboxyvinyltransferase [Acidimicrobiales bacterium]